MQRARACADYAALAVRDSAHHSARAVPDPPPAVAGEIRRCRGAFDRAMAAVLVVDDDAHIREVARFALARAGHAVELAGDGSSAAQRIARGGLALVVLDILMPELDGLSLCRQLRGRLPIVFLSSRAEEADRVLGLELGADDYLTKPFSPREPVARVAAVLRRTAAEAVPAARPVLAIGNVTIDRDRHAVHVAGAE